MNINVPFLVDEWKRVRESLLTQFPDIDPETLQDSVDGETAALDAIAGLIRAAREDEAMAAALAQMAKEMDERTERIEHRAKGRRWAALHLMNAIGVRKVERPDFTVSVRTNAPGLSIPDEAAVPDEFCQMKRTIDRRAIKEALTGGQSINWASLTPATESLSVRVK